MFEVTFFDFAEQTRGDMNKIAITTGDPNGIGAEITIKALNQLGLNADKVVLISNRKILDFYGKLKNDYEIIEIPFDSSIEPGKITAECGEFSFQSVKKACEIGANAIVTAPVAKNALYLAGHKFNGQTEIIQKYLAHDGQLAEMLFAAGNFRVLLLTRHTALKDIHLTKEIVIEKITNLDIFFREKFNISNPHFALCGFNPHAGEDGILGKEETEILNPAVKVLRKAGISITEPRSADTLFIKAAKDYLSPSSACGTFSQGIGGRKARSSLAPFASHTGEKAAKSLNDGLENFDCYIANYHDQGLIPIKTVAGDETVNMTIGLDIIRTSPGHGTAFDIAGRNIARENGMIAAIKTLI